MMTGDKRTAEAVAQALGIERVFAEVLPQDKAEGVIQLQKASSSPWSAMASTTPCPGASRPGDRDRCRDGRSGGDRDIVLMKSDPRDVLGAIQLSKATVRKMRQNLFWAAIYNLVAIPIAAGLLPCLWDSASPRVRCPGDVGLEHHGRLNALLFARIFPAQPKECSRWRRILFAA